MHATFDADGWICGRVTFQEHFVERVRSDEDVAHEYAGPRRDDFVAPGDHTSYAIAVDSSGRLMWESNEIDGDHVVAVLSERVSDDYLASLRGNNVSYVLAGAREVDLAHALEKIRRLFDIRTLILEGGGRINGGMLRAGLVDEVSVLIAPVVDGRMGEPALFDEAKGLARLTPLTLLSVEQRAGDMLWVRYGVGLSNQ